METPDTNAITVGTLQLNPAGQIFKKGKAMTTTNIWSGKDFQGICEWIELKTNATKLACSKNHTWLNVKSLRLDSQLISSDSPFYNCAVQLNTGGGAKDLSESYSSVLIHSDCFKGAHLTHLGKAVSRAHTESNRSGRIYHITPGTTTVVTPVTVKAPRTCKCPHCTADTPVPEHIHPHEWGVCGICGECYEYPSELF